MQLLPGGSPFSWPGKSGSRKIVSEPPCAICPTSRTWSDARSCPTAMRKRLSDTRGLGNHACFHHLRLDLTEACNQPCPSGPFGDKDCRRSYHRVDHVAAPKRGLLDLSRDSGANQCLVELDLCLRKRGFRTGFLGGQKGGKLCLDGLLVGDSGIERALPASAVICNRSTA